MAVGLDKRSLDAIHHDTTLIRQYGQHLRHDFLQMASMTADEDGVRTGEGREVCLQEIADMDVDARSTKTTSVLLDDGLALRTDLKSADLEMRELQTGFDRDAACAEADVPERVKSESGMPKGLVWC